MAVTPSTETTQQTHRGLAYAYLVWGLGALFVVYKLVSQTSYSVINPKIAEAASLSLSEVGALGSVYAFAFAIVTLISGALIDRYGTRRILTIAAATVALGVYFFSQASSMTALVLGQLLMGGGGAFGFPGAAYLTRHWFPVQKFGLMFGLVMIFVAVAAALAQTAIGFLLLLFDWRDILVYGALIGVAITVLLGVVLRESEEMLSGAANRRSTAAWKEIRADLKEVLTNKQVLIAAVLGAVVFGILLSLSVIWGIKLLIARGFDSTTASTINALIWLGFGIGAPLSAILVNRLQSFKISFLIGIGGLLLGVFALFYVPSLSVVSAVLLMLTIGFFTGSTMIAYTVTTEICRPQVSGSGFAIINMVSFIISGLMMAIPPMFIDDGDLGAGELASGLWLLPSCLVFGLVLLIFMRESYGVFTRSDDPIL